MSPVVRITCGGRTGGLGAAGAFADVIARSGAAQETTARSGERGARGSAEARPAPITITSKTSPAPAMGTTSGASAPAPAHRRRHPGPPAEALARGDQPARAAQEIRPADPRTGRRHGRHVTFRESWRAWAGFRGPSGAGAGPVIS